MHGPRGKCPTTPCIFRPARESRHHGRAPESMHDPSGRRSTQVLMFWRRDRSASVTGHVKRDRSCHRAALFCLAAPRQQVAALPGHGRGYYRCSGIGGPSTYRSAHSTRRKDKDLPSSGRAKALLAGWPPLPSGEEPFASPLAGRRGRPPLSRLQIAWAMALLSHKR
jgi:hypothetical protein